MEEDRKKMNDVSPIRIITSNSTHHHHHHQLFLEYSQERKRPISCSSSFLSLSLSLSLVFFYFLLLLLFYVHQLPAHHIDAHLFNIPGSQPAERERGKERKMNVILR